MSVRAGPQQKKTPPGWCFFFALAPCRRPTKLLLPLPFLGAGAKKNTPWVVFFFLLWPRAGAQGRSKKKNTLGGVFFFALAPCRRPTGLLLPLPFPGAGAKKKTPWVVFFFFALAPCRRPTKLLLPLPFPGAGAKKNTLSGVFFCSGPVPAPKAGAKKKTPWVVFFFCSGPVPAPNGASPSRAFPRGRSKKKTPWVVFFFFALAPPRRPTERNKKETLCTPGPTAKNFLETHDAGHEQKGATTKKNTLTALKWVMDVQNASAGLGFQHIGQLFPTLGGRLFEYLLAPSSCYGKWPFRRLACSQPRRARRRVQKWSTEPRLC